MSRETLLQMSALALFVAFGGALGMCHIKVNSFEWWLLDGLAFGMFIVGFTRAPRPR